MFECMPKTRETTSEGVLIEEMATRKGTWRRWEIARAEDLGGAPL